MAWSDNLLPEQQQAAAHLGSHARVLAGPGTGKTLTLTHRVLFLIEDQGVPPSEILVLTFTRAAAAELRGRIRDALADDQGSPYISTLHAFALRQLLLNSDAVDQLPRPVRVADDWEERSIVQEDLKSILAEPISKVKGYFQALSNDWDTLKEEGSSPDNGTGIPQFLGAWHEHRGIYGYTLRAELVYQVKRSLEQSGNFKLDPNFTHILVDEYQDLNLCDLAVIKAIVNLGPQLLSAGDDDQSIYGFRHAHPEGIRRFGDDYSPSNSLSLFTCMRCDREIIELAEFVANLDPYRIAKSLKPRPDAGSGQVAILRFADQEEEASRIAELCEWLTKKDNVAGKDVLILLRTDRNEAYSKPIKQALTARGLQVSTASVDPMEADEGRKLKSILHLIADRCDSLSVRTWLQLTHGIGSGTFNALYELAQKQSCTFGQATQLVQSDPSVLPQFGHRVKSELDNLSELLSRESDILEDIEKSGNSESLLLMLDRLVTSALEESDTRYQIKAHILSKVNAFGISTLEELLAVLSSSDSGIEPGTDDTGINIMTMHKAKGLTAEAVIVAAAEDEAIPGTQADSIQQGDERRLLYVSLTRARRRLFVTYCDKRTGQQQHTGSKAGKQRRSLTRFLHDVPIKPKTWEQFKDNINEQAS